MDAVQLAQLPSQALPRAGFWRRVLAAVIDALILGALFQAAAGFIYQYSDGALQHRLMIGGFTYCVPMDKVLADKVAEKVAIPELKSWTFAQDCRIQFVTGLTQARWGIIVAKGKGPVVTIGGEQKPSDLFGSVYLNSAGEAVQAFDWSWITELAIFVYTIALLTLLGRTIGMRVLHIRLIRLAIPERWPVALWRVLGRYVLFGLPLLPLVLMQVIIGLLSQGNLQAQLDLWRNPAVQVTYYGSILLAAAFMVWVVASLVRKRDPFYDRAFGVGVIRLTPPRLAP